ncbi:hypothetical protein BH11PSE4_BH11PSE4_24670 [soil metagenome]
MPRFYFPIVDGIRLDDPIGVDLPSESDAGRHAESIARHLAGLSKSRNVVAINEDGEEVYRVLVEKELQ